MPQGEGGRRDRGPRVSRRVSPAMILLMVLPVLGLGLVGWLVSARSQAFEKRVAQLQKQFDGKLAEIREKGEPLTLAELAPPAVPDDQNAAVLYEEAFTLLEKMPRETETRLWELFPRKGPTPKAEDVTEARKLLQPCQGALDLVRQGTLRPKCRFDLDYNADPGAMLLPHLSVFQRAGRLLHYGCRLEVAEGQPDAAVADCVTLLRLADGLKDEPILISQLVRIGAISLGTRGLATVLDQSEPTEAALMDAAGVLVGLEDRGPLLRGVKGEMSTGLTLIQQVLDDPARALASSSFGFDIEQTTRQQLCAPAGRPLLLTDATDYVHRMGRIQDLAAKPYYQTHAALKQLQDLIDQEHKTRPVEHFFTGLLLPSVTRVGLAHDRSLVAVGNARLAIALRLYRMKHGQYPDALAALAPDFIDRLPIDPFSGKDFIYQREGEGFVVQSVGDDEKSPTNQWWIWKCSR